MMIGYLLLLQIDVEKYLASVNGIHLFLGPMIVALAVPIFLNRKIIKKHFVSIMVGVGVGSVVSV